MMGLRRVSEGGGTVRPAPAFTPAEDNPSDYRVRLRHHGGPDWTYILVGSDGRVPGATHFETGAAAFAAGLLAAAALSTSAPRRVS